MLKNFVESQFLSNCIDKISSDSKDVINIGILIIWLDEMSVTVLLLSFCCDDNVIFMKFIDFDGSVLGF